MKPASFAYFAPRSLDEALSLLARYGDEARVLAGGQSLVPMMNVRVAKPAVLVSITHVPELAYIRASGDGLAIGAASRQIAVERSPDTAARAPLLVKVLPHVGTAATRNRGTLCGSLAHADPVAELPAASVALGATFTLSREGGRRQVAAEDFFQAELTTAVGPGELLECVTVPAAAPRSACGFAEVGNRRHGFAVAGVAGYVAFDEADRCALARLSGLGIGPTPTRLRPAEDLLAGRALSPAAIAEAGEAASSFVDPPGDLHADPAYRRDAVRVLVRRVLEQIRDEWAVRTGGDFP